VRTNFHTHTHTHTRHVRSHIHTQSTTHPHNTHTHKRTRTQHTHISHTFRRAQHHLNTICVAQLAALQLIHYHLLHQVESTFDKSADMRMRASANGFGNSERFNSPGSYIKRGDVPGPGAYSPPSQSRVVRPGSAPHGGRHNFRERSVDFGPKGEGADPAYNIQSTFDKAASRGSKPSSSFGTVRLVAFAACLFHSHLFWLVPALLSGVRDWCVKVK